MKLFIQILLERVGFSVRKVSQRASETECELMRKPDRTFPQVIKHSIAVGCYAVFGRESFPWILIATLALVLRPFDRMCAFTTPIIAIKGSLTNCGKRDALEKE